MKIEIKVAIKLGGFLICFGIFCILVGMDFILKWYGLTLIGIIIVLFGVILVNGIDDDMREFYIKNSKKH